MARTSPTTMSTANGRSEVGSGARRPGCPGVPPSALIRWRCTFPVIVALREFEPYPLGLTRRGIGGRWAGNEIGSPDEGSLTGTAPARALPPAQARCLAPPLGYAQGARVAEP